MRRASLYYELLAIRLVNELCHTTGLEHEKNIGIFMEYIPAKTLEESQSLAANPCHPDDPWLHPTVEF